MVPLLGALLFQTLLPQCAGGRVVGWPAPVRLRVEGLEQRPQQLVVLSEALPRFSFAHGLAGAMRSFLLGSLCDLV